MARSDAAALVHPRAGVAAGCRPAVVRLRPQRAESDWAIYYPRLPILEGVAAMAKENSSRVIGMDCLPAALAETHQLRDVRGYDAVDPARLVALTLLTADTNSPQTPYALTEMLLPKLDIQPRGVVRLPPILDMLAVRYLIFRGTPPASMTIPDSFVGPDYWVWENERALSRAFVPRRVETIADDKQRLSRMAAKDFDPREVAFVEAPLDLPVNCEGTAKIVDENPARVTLAIDMNTPGLVALADLWDKGWRAWLNGQPVPIVRANHALRGVQVPAGKGTLEFRYEPASVIWGSRLSGLALMTVLVWLGVSIWVAMRLPAAPVPSVAAAVPPEQNLRGESKRRRRKRGG